MAKDAAYYDRYNIAPEDVLVYDLLAGMDKQAPQQPKTTGFEGVGEDIAQGLGQTLPFMGEMALNLPGEVAGAAMQPVINPMRYLKNKAAGVVGSGIKAANIPSNIMHYLAEKGFVEPETAAMFPQAPLEPLYAALGLQGEAPGDAFLRGTAEAGPFVMGAGAAGGGRLAQGAANVGAAGLMGLANDENIIPYMLSALGVEAAPHALEAMRGKYRGPQQLPPPPGGEPPPPGGEPPHWEPLKQTVSDIFERVNKPFAEASEAERFVQALKEMEGESAAAIKEAQAEAASKYGELYNRQASENAMREAQIRHFANESESGARAIARGALKEKYGELYEEANQNYNNVYDIPVKGGTLGGQPIKHSFSAENLVENYKDGLRQLEEDNFFDRRRPIRSLKDLIDFRRDVTTERLEYGKRSVDKTLHPSDKRHAGHVAESLKELENYLNDVIETEFSLNGQPEAYSALKLADQWYSDFIQPFRASKFLKESAVNPKGNIKVANIFEELNKSGYDKLVERMFSDPKFKRAIAQHDLMRHDLTTEAGLQKALSGDFGKMLPNDVRNILEQQGYGLEKAKLIDSFSKEIARGELQRLVQDPKVQRLFAEHPELLEPLENIKQAQSRLAQIKKELIDAGMKQAEAQKVAEKYGKILKFAGYGLGLKFLGIF